METVSDYFPISTTQFLPDAEIPFDVFMYFKINQRLIQLKKIGDFFEKIKIDELVSKNIPYLYVRKNDKESFYKYKANVFTAAMNDQSLSAEKRAEFVQKKSQEAMMEISNVKTKEEADQIMDTCGGITKVIVSEVANPNFAKSYDNILGMVKTGSGLVVHSANVSSVSVMFAMLLKITDPKQIEDLAMGALVHDLGLYSIDETILKKYFAMEPLDPAEQEILESHPTKGFEMLKKKANPPNQTILDIVFQHHECQDGTGYPRRIKMMQIIYLAKIVAIADDFDIYYQKFIVENKFEFLKYIPVYMRDRQVKDEVKKRYDLKILDALINTMLPAKFRVLPDTLARLSH